MHRLVFQPAPANDRHRVEGAGVGNEGSRRGRCSPLSCADARPPESESRARRGRDVDPVCCGPWWSPREEEIVGRNEGPLWRWLCDLGDCR